MQSLVVAPDRVESVTVEGRREVFNLTVATAHEYFANGLLVSNCDAFLYAYLRASHYLEAVPDPEPETGSAAYWERERVRMRAEHEAAATPKTGMDPFDDYLADPFGTE